MVVKAGKRVVVVEWGLWRGLLEQDGDYDYNNA